MPALKFSDRQFRKNPYPLYEWLRKNDPVHKIEGLDAFFISKHSDVKALLKHEHLSLDQFDKEKFRDHPLFPYYLMREQLMLFQNGQRHEDLRQPVNPLFKPAAVKSWEEKIRQIAQEILHQENGNTFDAVTHWAQPFVSRVICEFLGLPKKDFSFITKLTQDVADGLDPFGSNHSLERAGKSYLQFKEYYKKEISSFSDTRSNPLGQKLQLCPHMFGSEEDFISTSIMLLAAGHQTTNHSISLALKTLLLDSELNDSLRQNKKVSPLLVEEIFRYHAPAQMVRRRVNKGLVVNNTNLPENTAVWLSIGSANRDAECFTDADADAFIADRKPNPHLAFGAGEHLCVGASLARIQLKIFLEEFYRLTDRYSLVEESIKHDNNLIFRGLKSMHLKKEKA